MTLLNLPFQEKMFLKERTLFLHMSRNVPFLFVPVRSSLDSVLRSFFLVSKTRLFASKRRL